MSQHLNIQIYHQLCTKKKTKEQENECSPKETAVCASSLTSKENSSDEKDAEAQKDVAKLGFKLVTTRQSFAAQLWSLTMC